MAGQILGKSMWLKIPAYLSLANLILAQEELEFFDERPQNYGISLAELVRLDGISTAKDFTKGLKWEEQVTQTDKNDIANSLLTSQIAVEWLQKSAQSKRDMLRHVLKEKYYFNFIDYGCHCLASDKLQRGKPVDEIDAACRQHAKCYLCNKMDYDGKMNNDKKPKPMKCQPSRTIYNYNVTKTDEGEVQINCNNELNTCQRSVCECDKRFAYRIRDLEDLYNPRFKGKGWKKDLECRHDGLMPSVPESDACCGAYPYRFPFSREYGKTCCDNKKAPAESRIYNPNVKICCDGRVKAIGSC